MQPKNTNRSLRRGLARKLKRCGKDGRVVIKAKYVLDTGRLFQPEVTVSGVAAEDPNTGRCVEKQLSRFKLLPRKEPSNFKPLEVPL